MASSYTDTAVQNLSLTPTWSPRNFLSAEEDEVEGSVRKQVIHRFWFYLWS